MDKGFAFDEIGDRAGDAVVEAAANTDDQVGFVDGEIGDGIAMHADHAGPIGVTLREIAEAEEGGNDGNVVALGEFDELGLGASDFDAVTSDDKGFGVGLFEEFGDALDFLVADLAVVWLVAGEVHFWIWIDNGFLEPNIFD